MKRIGWILALVALAGSAAWAGPLATAARSVIPKETQQIVCVDYRSLKASPTALALKDRVLPPNLKEFETALKSLGIDPDKEVESITFAAFRSPKGGLQMIGVAQGTFPAARVRQQLRAKKIMGVKYRDSVIYPSTGLHMSFLDEFTLLFGDDAALKAALDARDGLMPSLSSNQELSDLIASADNGPVWSVLDSSGTQNMMKSALGDASGLADYDVVKKRLVGSYYAMDFTNGVQFNLDVLTSDSMTAGALSSLVKAGMAYRRMMTKNASDKLALDAMTVDSSATKLQVHFKTDDKQFQSLLQSDFFAAVSH
jgi:hypothetical protein